MANTHHGFAESRQTRSCRHNLEDCSYTSEEILACTQARMFLEREGTVQMTPAQAQALGRWFNMQDKHGWFLPREEEKERIREYFRTFDDFFFFGLLRSRTVLGSYEDLTNEMGYTDVTSRQYCRMADVMLNLRRNCSNESDERRFERVIGTVLHEQLHAFIDILCCDCPHCVPDLRESIGRWGHRLDGHGWLWSTLALRIEQICATTFPFVFELGISDNITLQDFDVLLRLQRSDVLTRIVRFGHGDPREPYTILEEDIEMVRGELYRGARRE